MSDRYVLIRPSNMPWHNTNNSLHVTRRAMHNLASSARLGSVSSRKIAHEFSITSGQTADKSSWAIEGAAARGRRLKIERERYPRISQPATPQMKHTWVVLDLARIIPHPRLSTTHRANTATHVEQTHTRDSRVHGQWRDIWRYERCLEIFARLDCSRKKRAYPLGKITPAVHVPLIWNLWHWKFYLTRLTTPHFELPKGYSNMLTAWIKPWTLSIHSYQSYDKLHIVKYKINKVDKILRK